MPRDLENVPGRNRLAGKIALIIGGGSIGPGWDAACAALFFASDESAYVTVQMLVVDGGVASTAPGV